MNLGKRFRLSRRTFLRGSGVAVALPYLQAMMRSSAVAEAAAEAPSRMGTFYFGTGMNMRQFTPADEGPNYTATRILKPLDKHRGSYTVLSNMYLAEGGGHDGAYPFATAVAKGEKQRISPDQIAAKAIGGDTRFASLQMSVDRGTNYGSQALATSSWNEQGVPLAAENDPKRIFDRLFRPDTPEQKAQEKGEFRRRGSVLDYVRADAKRLDGKLGKADRQQLEQYFNSVRELEQQLERRIDWADKPKPQPQLDGLHDYAKPMPGPEGNGEYLYDDYAKMMYDLIVLAFQTDSTRVISYVVRKELAGGVYPEFHVSKGYHALTHHGNDPQNLEELAKVDTIYMTHWAYLLSRLQSVKEGDGTLLDRTVLGLSSGMGFEHSKDNLPTILSGGAGLGVKHQGHLKLKDQTPISSMWHTMVDRVGVKVEGDFQDSKGVIKPLVT
ncbi:MAG: DUF1552 domain-containing protein [Phycisphaera sp.]|nr:DUF1552 domain-containing protein [Phycisphaera sp.]